MDWVRAVWDRVKENPAATLQLLQVLLGALVAFELLPFTENQQAGVMATTAAVLNLAIALAVRQFAWPLITALVQAAIPMGLGFGLDWNEQQVGIVYALVGAIGAWWVRSRVTPETKLAPLRAVETEPGVWSTGTATVVDTAPAPDTPQHRRDPSAGGPGSW